jgi:hypothetical protein
MSAERPHLYLPGLLRLLRGDEPVAGFDQARLQSLLADLVLHRTALISQR